MKKSLSHEQEMLLYKACKENGGILKMEMAQMMYSSKSSAKNAVQTLKTFDYVEKFAPGVFEVKKVPSDVKEELRHLQDDSDDEKEYEVEE